MIRHSTKLFLVILFTILARTVSAEEIYTFIMKDCSLNQGLVLDVSDATVGMLELDGHYKVISRVEITALLIHNVLENPITEITMSEELNRHLQFVAIGGKKETSFTGWPVRFVENLVVYHDLQGNSHVVELAKIDRIRPYEVKETHVTRHGLRPRLALGDVAVSCPKHATQAGEIIATRTLSDQIQISELLTDFHKGFERIDSFRERTYLYAKPYLFERETKLGIRFGQALLVPSQPAFYVQWATGQEYRFQSFNQIGTAANEYAPTIDPLFLVRSDLKSHFFHASFVGNLLALSAGKDTLNSADDLKSLRKDKTAFSAVSFNYLTLLGGDYGPWSFSFGTFYPDIAMIVNDTLRDVLASDVSPIFRVMLTAKQLQARVLFSPIKMHSNGPTKDDLTIDGDQSVNTVVKDFDFKGYFARAGATYKILPDLELAADQIWLHGNYSDDLISSGSESFTFDQYITEASVRHWFGRLVTLKVVGDWVTVKNNFRFASANSSETITNTRLGGVFEFVF